MYAYNLGLHFESVAAQHAARPALWLDRETVVSYGELNAQANRIARWLVARGVAAHDTVCLSGTKSRATFAALVACLKLGAPYAILDPDSPGERLRKIIETCRPKLLIGERALLVRLDEVVGELELALASTEELAAVGADYAAANLAETRAVTGAHAAYVMFTSGSTGVPKGAAMAHASVLNLIAWSREAFSLTPEDRLTNVNPLFFDNSVFDLYAALFTGACLVPFAKEEVRDPRLLVAKVEAAACTLWFSVPSLLIFLQTMKAADGRHLRTIRRFVFGGEGYPKAKLKKLFDAYADTAQFFNVYGPTECTCICSCHKLAAADFADLQGLPPLGQIADNFSFLILDEEGRKVPAGTPGELCLSGPNVGLGYYNDPARTALAFVPNPDNEHFGELMYKTGDMVRLDPADGRLYIHGRRDNQIKHMGYRIELEEIEAALHRLDYVAEAAALHASAGGLSRIVAVVAARRAFDDNELRRDLRRIIPDYMIPSAFYREASLPKNPNGKIDRRSLAEKYL